MILLDNAVISDDIAEKHFVCDLIKCKGACCIEGDLGAPLEKEEIELIKKDYDKFTPYMSSEGIKAIEEQGFFVEDFEGDFSTPTIGDRECAYAFYNENNILKCAIEQAYLNKETDFQKPISCHLYPIRIKKAGDYDMLNYDRWHICAPACENGEKLGVEVYKFLKGPLVRKYGEKWYQSLEQEISESKES